MTSSCSLPSNTSKTATEDDLQARIAQWIELKIAATETFQGLTFQIPDWKRCQYKHRWPVKELRNCNIRGGEEIHNSFQDGGPPGFSSISSEGEWIFRQVEPGRVGGEEEESFYFCARNFISIKWGLCLLGCIYLEW